MKVDSTNFFSDKTDFRQAAAALAAERTQLDRQVQDTTRLLTENEQQEKKMEAEMKQAQQLAEKGHKKVKTYQGVAIGLPIATLAGGITLAACTGFAMAGIAVGATLLLGSLFGSMQLLKKSMELNVRNFAVAMKASMNPAAMLASGMQKTVLQDQMGKLQLQVKDLERREGALNQMMSESKKMIQGLNPEERDRAEKIAQDEAFVDIAGVKLEKKN